MTEQEAEQMVVRKLGITGVFELDADFSMGGGDIILAHARRA